MDEKKIAFILCVNDEMEYMECKQYLDYLIVPEGYVTDIFAVQEAPSMAAGYNAGMQNSDAAYKVYLHQDVFIINRNFIGDMLAVFGEDARIGLMGCVGASHLDGICKGCHGLGYRKDSAQLYTRVNGIIRGTGNLYGCRGSGWTVNCNARRCSLERRFV